MSHPYRTPGIFSYMKQIDLNPATPGLPVIDPLDERALHLFGVSAGPFGQPTRSQKIKNLGTTRVLVSFDYGYKSGFGSQTPPTVHATVEPDEEIETFAFSRHALVWLQTAPTQGVQALVRVSAW